MLYEKSQLSGLFQLDHFAAGDSRHGAEQEDIDRFGDVTDRAVAQGDRESAGMQAAPGSLAGVGTKGAGDLQAAIIVGDDRPGLQKGQGALIRSVGIGPKRASPWRLWHKSHVRLFA